MAAEQATAGQPVRAVILEAPYTTIPEVAQHHYFYVPALYLVRDRYDSRARIASIAAPLLIVHGELDRTIPIRFGRTLFEAAREPKQAVWLPTAGHNDIYEHGAWEVMRAFLARQN